MRKSNGQLSSRSNTHLAIASWLTIASSVIVFTSVATLLSALGASSEKSIIYSFLIQVVFILSAQVYFYKHNYYKTSSFIDFDFTEIAERATRLYHRTVRTFAGAKTADFVVDMLRMTSIAGLTILVFNLRGDGGFGLFERVVLVTSVGILIFQSVVYPIIRGENIWETEYKLRKAMTTNAINYAAKALEDQEIPNAVNQIEKNALRCIESYLKYMLVDRQSKFHANLIIRHPSDPKLLVCIQRTDNKSVPKYYDAIDMPTSMKVLRDQRPIYISNFVGKIRPHEFKMVWQIPILYPQVAATECLGILAIDSMTARHLDLVDDREALLFSLLPYISLLRYSLVMRSKHEAWGKIRPAHLDSQMNIFDLEKNIAVLAEEFTVDRNVDKESLVAINQSDFDDQRLTLQTIAASFQSVTPARRFFKMLFPQVELNSRRISG